MQALGHAGGKVAASLDGGRFFIDGAPVQKRRGERVGGGDGVLNGEVDADASDGRHGVSGVADAQELAATSDGGDVFAERGQALIADGVESAFGDHVCALQLVAAVDRDEDSPLRETAEGLIGAAGQAGEPHPERVDGRCEIDDVEPGFPANL